MERLPKPGGSRKKDDYDADLSPLLDTNHLKYQRLIDEHQLKVLKWNFTTPTKEFIELLKQLMSIANVNKSLLANMFHTDFRYHLKAIEALIEDLPDNSKALILNLDLILKWLTLRFFDTYPSVLLKGLEYLQLVFNLLIEKHQYCMLDNEAASFIPYLIIKIGDSRGAVRNRVRSLFKQIALIYPVDKLFSYLVKGLKSKNARQRTECLDQLSYFIKNYGLSVCQPSTSTALKKIAKQIADRGNSVRNAALNCIVQAYFLQGERIYKLIGQISEKDQSLLDGRIKRTVKNRSIKSASPNELTVSTNTSVSSDEVGYDKKNEEATPVTPPPNTPVIHIKPPKLLVSESALMAQQQLSTSVISEERLVREILAMGSLDLAAAIELMKSINNLLKIWLYNQDKCFGLINMQLKHLQDYSLQQKGVYTSKGFKKIFLVLLMLCDTGSFCQNVSLIHLKELMDQMISLVAENKLNHLDLEEYYYSVINIIVRKIIDNANRTTIICVLIKLLHGYIYWSTAPSKYEELVVECLWKISKRIPNWAADLDYDTILLEVHRFLKSYPTIWWKERKSDSPLRTIETILRSITRVERSKILSHLTRINDTNESELYSYLLRLIATKLIGILGQSEHSVVDPGKTQEHLSKSTHQQLDEIFKAEEMNV